MAGINDAFAVIEKIKFQGEAFISAELRTFMVHEGIGFERKPPLLPGLEVLALYQQYYKHV